MDGLEYRLVDLKGLLLMKYKELGIQEDELVVLLILILYEGCEGNWHNLLEEKMNYPTDQIDEILVRLMQKRLVSMNGMNLDITLLKNRLFANREKEEKIDLITVFEKEFARALSPTELEAIRTWKNNGIEDDFIHEALKEASLRNIHSIRYIDAIIRDWQKNGMKKSGREKIPAKPTVEYNDYKWWEED